MTDFSKGKWIEWTGSDEEGTFAHVGEVVSSTKTTVTFAVPHGGQLTVEKKDGSFKNVRSRKSRAVRPPKHLAAPVTRPLSERMQQVVALFEKGTTISRQDAIAKIVAEMGMTAAGASTYWNTARKFV